MKSVVLNLPNGLSTLGQKLKHELRELIPVTVFFFVTFRELVRALGRERVIVMLFHDGPGPGRGA